MRSPQGRREAMAPCWPHPCRHAQFAAWAGANRAKGYAAHPRMCPNVTRQHCDTMQSVDNPRVAGTRDPDEAGAPRTTLRQTHVVRSTCCEAELPRIARPRNHRQRGRWMRVTKKKGACMATCAQHRWQCARHIRCEHVRKRTHTPESNPGPSSISRYREGPPPQSQCANDPSADASA